MRRLVGITAVRGLGLGLGEGLGGGRGGRTLSLVPGWSGGLEAPG